ncbi:MAG TPA: FAD-dependent oxidoreductase [Polyangiaceae bacterium]|nr:FAD-dependent oxidoreductase [Polyangiaceae bacterium]
MGRKRYVIIGDGAAGVTAAERLRRQDPQALIALISDEPYPHYYRAALTNYLLGELREDQLFAVPPDFYEALQVRRVFGRVTAVDPARASLRESSSAVPVGYDALLIASGARPRPPSFDGSELTGIVTLRTLHDARRISQWLRAGGLRKAVVVGAGALGLEWAHALLEQGVSVTLIERAPRLLPSALDQTASDLLAARLRQAGVDVRLGEQVGAAEPSRHGTVGRVVTATGASIDCDLVAVALGVQANTEFLAGSSIALAPSGAVIVDRRLQTSAAGVWAAGDVAVMDGQALQLWEPARQQGRIAADNMVGRAASYEMGAHYFATRLFDLDFARVGRSDEPGAEAIVDFPRGTGSIAYRKLVVQEGRLIGALMIGERPAKVRRQGRSYKRLIDAGVDCRPIQHQLMDPGFDIDAWLETYRLVHKPPPPRPVTAAAAPAKLRGTQLLGLTHLRAAGGATRALQPPPSPAAGATAALLQAAAPAQAVLAPPRATRMLSIGLQAEASAELAAPPIDAWLEASSGRHGVSRAVTDIGSGPAAALRVAAAGAADLHAQLVVFGQRIYLRDLGSGSGTRLNEHLVEGQTALCDGDIIGIGSERLRFRCPAAGPRPATRQELSGGAPAVRLRSGPLVGLSMVLGDVPLTIGRWPDCGLRLDAMSVSRRHAVVTPHAGFHYLSDAGSRTGTFLRGRRLGPGEQVPLELGESFHVGGLELGYELVSVQSALRVRGRLTVDGGADAGKQIEFGERALVGSDERSSLQLRGMAPQQLELWVHEGRFFARDLSGGGTYRAGRPLGAEFVPIGSGEMLVVASGATLRFEEVA